MKYKVFLRPSNDNITYQKIGTEMLSSLLIISVLICHQIWGYTTHEFNEGDVIGIHVYQLIIFKCVVTFIEIQTPLFSLITNPTNIPKTLNLKTTLTSVHHYLDQMKQIIKSAYVISNTSTIIPVRRHFQSTYTNQYH